MLCYWTTPYKMEFFIPGRKYSIQELKCTPDKDGFVKTKLITKRLVEKDQQMSSVNVSVYFTALAKHL